jgi:hypothetical protein
LLLIMILLPGSNLESKSKSMSKSKRQGISPNSMAVRRRGQSPAPFSATSLPSPRKK